jgi:predicted transcriptional regulator
VMTRPFVFSIRPAYVAMLLAGTKTVEYRTRRPSLERGDTILIYETAPRSMVVATATVGELIVGKPAEVWAETHARGGIARATFDRYFAGRELAVALEVDVAQLAIPIPLLGQRAPQAWARWRGPWPLGNVPHG